tara:strand:+ start:284 stop:499 length:216 start_codon:yes stop_codon:yes gene_type:complete
MPKDDNAGFLPDWNKMSGADKIPASSEAGGYRFHKMILILFAKDWPVKIWVDWVIRQTQNQLTMVRRSHKV